MAGLTLADVSNRFVRNVCMHVPPKSACAVVGPSGAGKTSLLRIIAGLDGHTGTIRLDDRDIRSVEPHRRNMGFLAQDPYLFPHMSVEANLLLAMERVRNTRAERRRQAADILERLRISHLADRRPATLSGGERQRAALARTLASSPALLLLDEPFSKLDHRTAHHLRDEFGALRKELGLTTILVTHDLAEAKELTEHLFVMHVGHLIPVSASPERDEAEAEAAESFLGAPNILPCRERGRPFKGVIEAEWAGGMLLMPDEGRPFSRFLVSRRDVEVGRTAPPGPELNRFSASVRSIVERDDVVSVALDVNGTLLYGEIGREQAVDAYLLPGAQAQVLLRLRSLHPFT